MRIAAPGMRIRIQIEYSFKETICSSIFEDKGLVVSPCTASIYLSEKFITFLKR